MKTDTDYTILLTVTSTYTLASETLTTQDRTVITIPDVTTVTLQSSHRATSSTPSITRETSTLSIKNSSKASSSSSISSSLASPSITSLPNSTMRDDNLLKLGLSVGLPIAIISVFVVALLGWYYVTRRHSRNGLAIQQQEGQFISVKNSTKEDDMEVTTMVEDEGSKRKSRMDFFGRMGRSIRDSHIFPVNGRCDKRGGVSPFVLRKFNLKTELEKPLPVIPSSRSIYTNSLPDMENTVPTLDPKPVSSARLVVKPYNKKLFDEILVEKGDIVRVIKEHSDGWSFVQMAVPTNRSNTGKEGMVPNMCLKEMC